VQRTIKPDTYAIQPHPRSEAVYVELKLVGRRASWELNGEPMETVGEVMANDGRLIEDLDRRIGSRTEA
jgi:hypothetical protein